MRLALGNASWRMQLGVAFASMIVIPLLTFCYILVFFLIPDLVPRNSLLVVVSCNLLLAMAGFRVLVKTIGSLARFRGYMEEVARGDLTRELTLRNGPEVASIQQSVEMIVERLRQDRERLEAFSQNLEREVQKRTEELNRDIEQRKKTEQALRESNMMLSDALSGLKEMEHRLVQEERMSALGQMASSIAHDFNNALMPIVGLSEFLLLNREKLDDKEELVATLEDIHTSADRARNAVVRLREFYKTDDDVELGVVEANVVFDKAIAVCGVELQRAKRIEKPVEVCRDFGEVPFVNADELELREALRNIIVNAIESMQGAGGVLTCRSYAEHKWVVLEVSDTGCGMSHEVQARCMEPFFTTKGMHGAGIGLSVVYGIVRRHKGSIEIASEPGKGTTVKIMLPLAKPPSEQTRIILPGSGQAGPLRILVVDDDVSPRKLLSKYLMASGHTVETAETGAAGLALFERDKFDLVITDRAMPDMSGDAVAAAIAKSGRNVPVIMLTGFGEIMKDKNEVPDGVSLVLSKPISLKELKSAIAVTVAGQTPGG